MANLHHQHQSIYNVFSTVLVLCPKITIIQISVQEFGGKASGNRFPVFVFYPSYLKVMSFFLTWFKTVNNSSEVILIFQGIQYRGPIRADHLISWILRCRYPVIPLLDVNHFNQISTEHSNVLVGYLPQLRTNKLDSNLPPLLQCANSLLETDPDTRVLVTSDANLARALHLHVNHPLRFSVARKILEDFGGTNCKEFIIGLTCINHPLH